jgi:plasmid stabilization system protein ParE
VSAHDPAPLAPRLRTALDAIVVEPGGTRARTGRRTLEADGPRELRHLLASALYDELHAGRPQDEGARPRTLREPEMEARLAEATPHRTTRVHARVHAAEDDGTVLVELDGVRVRVARGLVRAGTAAPGEEVELELAAARPALSPGFFLVDGSRGSRGRGGPLRRVYVHLEGPDAAPSAWNAVLGRLEALAVPYRAKISSSRRLFPRRDALVVYLGPGHWAAAEQLVAVAGAIDGRGETVSAFADPLAPGLAAAWEPVDPRPGMRGLSFGQHRSLAVAEGLVTHAVAVAVADGASASREQAVAVALRAAGADPLDPGRNLPPPSRR